MLSEKLTHILRLGSLLVVSLAVAAPARAQSQDAQAAIDAMFSIERSFLAGDPQLPAPIQAYNKCIIPKIRSGQFSSLDGGRSALKLESNCLDEAEAVTNDCNTRAGGKSDLCKVTPAYLAQAALKLLNK